MDKTTEGTTRRTPRGHSGVTERELRVLLAAGAVKRVEIHHAVMSSGYMVVVDGKPLQTLRRDIKSFKTLDGAARTLFHEGIASFNVKLVQNP